MRKVLINKPFTDRETGVVREANSIVELSERRIAEINALDSKLITVLAEVQEDENAEELESTKAELESTKEELERIKAELEKTKAELKKEKAKKEKPAE